MKDRPVNRQYAHRILRAVHHAEKRTRNLPHPVDQGVVLSVGPDESDIVVELYNSTNLLTGDDIQWMIDETRLQEGDTVTVVFDVAGDPTVIAAIFQSELANPSVSLPSGIDVSVIGATGPPGPTGAQGPVGPTGPAGGGPGADPNFYSYPQTSVATNYDVGVDDRMIWLDHTATVTMNLPTAAGPTALYIFKDAGYVASQYPVRFSPPAPELFEGTSLYTMVEPGFSLTVARRESGGWHII